MAVFDRELRETRIVAVHQRRIRGESSAVAGVTEEEGAQAAAVVRDSNHGHGGIDRRRELLTRMKLRQLLRAAVVGKAGLTGADAEVRGFQIGERSIDDTRKVLNE